MQKIQRPLLGIFMLVSVCLVAAMGVIAAAEKPQVDTRPIIIIDAGHGGLVNTTD